MVRGRRKKTDKEILEELIEKLAVVEKDQEALYNSMKVLMQRINYYLKTRHADEYAEIMS